MSFYGTDQLKHQIDFNFPKKENMIFSSQDERENQKEIKRWQNILLILPAFSSLIFLLITIHMANLDFDRENEMKPAIKVLQFLHQNLYQNPIQNIKLSVNGDCLVEINEGKNTWQKAALHTYQGVQQGCTDAQGNMLGEKECEDVDNGQMVDGITSQNLYIWDKQQQFCIQRNEDIIVCENRQYSSHSNIQHCGYDICVNSLKQCPLNQIDCQVSKKQYDQNYKGKIKGAEYLYYQKQKKEGCIQFWNSVEEFKFYDRAFVQFQISTRHDEVCLNQLRFPTFPDGHKALFYPLEIQQALGCDKYGSLRGKDYVQNLNLKMDLKQFFIENSIWEKYSHLPNFDQYYQEGNYIQLVLLKRIGIMNPTPSCNNVQQEDLSTIIEYSFWARRVCRVFSWIIFVFCVITLFLSTLFGFTVVIEFLAVQNSTRATLFKLYQDSAFVICILNVVFYFFYLIGITHIFNGYHKKLLAYRIGNCFNIDGINLAMDEINQFNEETYHMFQPYMITLLLLSLLYFIIWFAAQHNFKHFQTSSNS